MRYRARRTVVGRRGLENLNNSTRLPQRGFHRVRDAGKVAFVALAELLRAGGYLLHDTQYCTDYLAQFGCIEVSADEFLDRLKTAVALRAAFAPPS